MDYGVLVVVCLYCVVVFFDEFELFVFVGWEKGEGVVCLWVFVGGRRVE